MRYWELIADNLKQSAVGAWVMSRRWIPTGKQSGLLTRIVTTETVSSSGRMKN
jgi:hypothetical protein